MSTVVGFLNLFTYQVERQTRKDTSHIYAFLRQRGSPTVPISVDVINLNTSDMKIFFHDHFRLPSYEPAGSTKI